MSLLRRRSGHHALVLLLLALLALVLTYPLAPNLASHVPGDGIDDPALAWNLWWIKFSLVDRQANPFDGDWMFFPIGINLAFYTLTVLNGLLSIPLQTALGLVVASNLILLSSFVLSGYGAYLLALQALRSQAHPAQPVPHATRVIPNSLLRTAALLAALLYAFASAKLFYASLGQFNIASSQWIPFCVLYLMRSARPRAGLREPLLAGLFLLLQAYAELIFASFLVIFVGLFAAYSGLGWGWRWVGGVGGRRGRMEDRVSESRSVGVAEGGGREIPERSGGKEQWVFGRNLVVLALVVLVGLVPVLANMLPDLRSEGDFLVEGGGFADTFSADLAGYALPTQLHPIFGNLIRQAADDSQVRDDGSHWPVDKGQHLFLGYVILALALVGLARGGRRTAFWGLSALVFFLLTLGPTVRVAGYDTGLPGPYRLLQLLPFFKGNRYPSRYGVMLLVSLAPLVAAGCAGVLARWRTGQAGPETGNSRRRSWFVPLILGSLMLFEHLSIPLPLSDMGVPAIYETIAADPASGAVLDLPLGWRNGFSVFGKQDLIIMSQQWWQTTHRQPILGGNTSRNPEHKFRYFLEAPLLGTLVALANADEDHPHLQNALSQELAVLRTADPDLDSSPALRAAKDSAAGVLYSLNIRYVVLHRDQVPPEFVTFIERALPVRALAEAGAARLYAVDRPVPTLPITLSPAEDPLTRGEGWSGQGQVQVVLPEDDLPETASLWAHREQTRLLIPPVPAGHHLVSVRAFAAGHGQSLALEVNGFWTDRQLLPQDWTTLTYPLPAGTLGETVNDIHLRFGLTYPARAETIPGDPGPPPASLLVESAGLEAGNYAHIWLDGRDLGPGARGYNLAIIDAQTFEPLAVAAFDTHADPEASRAMVEWLGQMEEGKIRAVAVKDTASDRLSADAADRLRSLGLTDLRGRFRWSQAGVVIGLGGKTQDVWEQVSGTGAASVGWGPGWREQQVAAAVSWLRVE